MKQKILHLIAPVAFGGGESLLINLLQPGTGLEQSVALIYHSAAFEAKLAELNVPYWVLRAKAIGHGISKGQMGRDTLANLWLVRQLRQLVSTQQIDLLHVHGYPACVLFALLRRLVAVRGIYTHHSLRQSPSWLERSLLTPVYQSFDVCTGVSTQVCQSMAQAFPPVQFQCVYNCVGDGFYQATPDLDYQRQWPANKTVFVQVARFLPTKNHQLVVESLQQLAVEVRAQLLVVFAGEGPTESTVMAQVAQYHLQEQVLFLGAVPYERVPGLLAAAGFGLFPAEQEGFGIAAVECLAAGLPVLSLDTPLMREVIGSAGLQCSRDRFHEGFQQMIEQGEQLRSQAKRRAADFRAATIRTQYAMLYRQIWQN